MEETLKIHSKMHAPIEEYRDLLNYCSQTYGTPFSLQMKREQETVEALKDIYEDALAGMTHIITEEKHIVKPTDRKYNFMEFQRDFLDVPEGLMYTKGTKGISADQSVRTKIDKECPNFMNSLFSMWGDLNSRARLGNVAKSLQLIEGQKDAFGEPLAVVRTSYDIKYESTLRLTTNTPNLQGLSTLYKKEFLIPEEGRVLVGADISSQEPVIFFNGLCRDEEILKMYMECGEIYRPVVARVEGIDPTKVSKELRNAYKVGILAKMNNGGIGLVAQKMGSMELASRFMGFIDSNPNYRKFIERVNRQLNMPEPRMAGFIEGRERVLTSKKFGAFNQLVNAPLQITAVSFFAISFFALVQRLMNEIGDWATIQDLMEDIRPVYHAHDEIVFSVADKNGYPEATKEILRWALQVQFEDWTPMRAEPYISKRYQH